MLPLLYCSNQQEEMFGLEQKMTIKPTFLDVVSCLDICCIMFFLNLYNKQDIARAMFLGFVWRMNLANHVVWVWFGA